MAQEEVFIIKLKDQFTQQLKTADAAIDHTREKFGAMQAAVLGSAVVVGIVAEIKTSIEAWNESEKAIAQVRSGIESTGGVAGRTLEQLEAQASAFQGKTLFGDDEILDNVTAKLLTFTNITGDAFDKAQGYALDMATKLKTDAGGAALQLGKALNDPIQGVNALRRAGVSFSDSQKAMIKSLQETGHFAEAQNIIFNELQKEFGGSAEAAAKAGTGGWVILSNAINDNEEKIGGAVNSISSGLLPVLTKMNELVGEGIDFLTRHSSIVKVVLGYLGGLVIAVTAVVGATQLWAAGQWLLNAAMTANPIGLVVIALAGMVAAIAVAWNEFAEFRGAVKGVWAVLEQVYHNVVDKFTSIPTLIIEAFKAIPTAIANIFGGVGDLINAVLTGNFKDVPKLLANIGSEALKANPLTAVPAKLISEFSEGTTGAFKKVYDKELEDSKASTLAEAAAGNKSKTNTTGTGLDKSGLGAGISEIKTGAPKTFNINIGNVVKEFTVATTNLIDDPSKVKAKLEEIMLTVLNNMQVIAS